MSVATDKSVRAARVIDRCRKLATFSERPDSLMRTFLSPPMHDCHREIRSWLEPLGAIVRIDAAGNLRAEYPGKRPGPRLLIGSHLDTVPDAGAFDGILGVVLGVVILEELHGERLNFAIEVIGFSEEEGVRFGTPFIGSRAVVGRIDEALLGLQDSRGISVRGAINNFGSKADDLAAAQLSGDVFGFVEFHIEQGPVLESLGLPLGVVEAVAGQSRLELTFAGRANHAGTTPMELRRDSLAAAAEWIAEVERYARRIPGLVATVGSIEVKPGATNVIAGETRATLDVRHKTDDVRKLATSVLITAAQEIAARRNLKSHHRVLSDLPAVAMDEDLSTKLDAAIRAAGVKPHRMVSGAGHDAMILAEKVPAAMIFLRTPGGISHSPEETVIAADVEHAIEAGLQLLRLIDSSVAQDRLVQKGD